MKRSVGTRELPVSFTFFSTPFYGVTILTLNLIIAYKFPKAPERLEELKKGGAKAQKGRERISRSDQKATEADCSIM